MMYLLQLCLEFLKTGLCAVGGGLATLPFLNEMGLRYTWFTQEDIGNMLAVSESTPGPIGVNMATYAGNIVGHTNGGIWIGVLCGILTTLSLVLPSYLVILFVSRIMNRFRDNRYVDGAMKTLRPASVGMVTSAVLGILSSVLIDLAEIRIGEWCNALLYQNVILFAVLFILYQLYNKLHPVVLLLIGAVAGIIFKL